MYKDLAAKPQGLFFYLVYSKVSHLVDQSQYYFNLLILSILSGFYS